MHTRFWFFSESSCQKPFVQTSKINHCNFTKDIPTTLCIRVVILPIFKGPFWLGKYFILSLCFRVDQSLCTGKISTCRYLVRLLQSKYKREGRIQKNMNMFCRLHCKDPWLNYSAAVSSCFKEAGGKLVLFTANIVRRFSHPNKIIEAQERKKRSSKGTSAKKLTFSNLDCFSIFQRCCWHEVSYCGYHTALLWRQPKKIMV